MADESKYFDDSYAELVTLRDGVPVRYSSLGLPREPGEVRELAERIRVLTGFSVRFGEWVRVIGDPRDGGAEVPLHVAPRGFDERGEMAGVRFGAGRLALHDPRARVPVTALRPGPNGDLSRALGALRKQRRGAEALELGASPPRPHAR
jgi:hypothetical protein